MDLSIEEYRWIRNNCRFFLIEHEGKSLVALEANQPKNTQKLDNILEGLNLDTYYPKLDDFNKSSKSLSQKLLSFDQDRYLKSRHKLLNMSTQELATMPTKEKIEILDGVILDVFDKDRAKFEQNKNTIKAHKERFMAVLYNLEIPAEFVAAEKKKAKRFCNLLKEIPNFKNDLESWHTLDRGQKRGVCDSVLEVFNYAYDTNIKINYFSSQSWEEDIKKSGIDTQKRSMPTGYAQDGDIFISEDRLDFCSNLAITSLIFHEGLHVTQEQKDWSEFPIIDKLFEKKFSNLALDQEDLYPINPIESHAYGLDNEVTNFLQEEMGIRFIDSKYPPKLKKAVRNMQTKSVMAFYHQQLSK